MEIMWFEDAKNETTTLQIVTFTFTAVGFILSIASLILLILTALLFEEWRQKYKNQVLIQFMIARFLFVLVRFVFDASLVFGFYHEAAFLLRYDMMLHVFTELAIVSWMFVFTKTMYDSLVIIIMVPPSYRLLKASLCAWVIPLITAIIVNLVPFLRGTLYFHYYLLYYFFVKWPLLFWNGVILVKTLRSLSSKNRTLCHNRPENSTKIVVTMVFLIFVFSFQQISHDIYKIVFLVLYHIFGIIAYFIKSWVVVINIVALYYCPVSITFWVICNRNTRELWKTYVKKKIRL